MLPAGQHAQCGFYVVNGLVRELYIDAGGEEHTRAFVAAGGFTGSLLDLLSGQSVSESSPMASVICPAGGASGRRAGECA